MDVIPLLGVVIAAMSAVAVAFSAVVNFRAYKYQAQIREMDVVLRCQDKFNTLVFDVKRKAAGSLRNFRVWNAYYWSLQADQFLYWRRGWIGDEIMLHWLEHRFNSFRNNETDVVESENVDYGKRFEWAKETVKDKSFLQLMRYIQSIASPGANYDYGEIAMRLKAIRRGKAIA